MADQIPAPVPSWFERLEDPRCLWLLLGASLVLKSLLLLLVDPVSADSSLYITAAHYFSQGDFGQGLAVYPLPLYPLLLAAFHLILPTWELAALPTTLGASVLTLVPLYRLTRDLFGGKAAFWAGTAFTLSPYLNHYGIYIIRDPGALLAFAWALAFTHRFLVEGALRWLAAGFVATLTATGLRAETMFFLGFYPLFLLALARVRPRHRRCCLQGAGVWVALTLAVAIVFMLSLPNTWLYLTQSDYFSDKLRGFLSADSLETYQTINRDLKEFQRTRDYLDPGGHNLITLVRAYMPLIYVLGVIECFLRMLYPLYGIALIYGLRKRLNPNRALVFATGLLFLVSAYLFLLTENWLSKRYLSITVLCLLPWVGVGSAELLDRFRAGGKRAAVGLALVLLVAAPLVGVVAQHSEPKDPTLRTVGLWIGSQPELKEARIHAGDNRIILYAEHYADIPRWGDLKTLRLKKLSPRSRDKIVVLEPDGSDAAGASVNWDQLVLVRAFSGPLFKVDVYGPPELAARLQDR